MEVRCPWGMTELAPIGTISGVKVLLRPLRPLLPLLLLLLLLALLLLPLPQQPVPAVLPLPLSRCTSIAASVPLVPLAHLLLLCRAAGRAWAMRRWCS